MANSKTYTLRRKQFNSKEDCKGKRRIKRKRKRETAKKTILLLLVSGENMVFKDCRYKRCLHQFTEPSSNNKSWLLFSLWDSHFHCQYVFNLNSCEKKKNCWQKDQKKTWKFQKIQTNQPFCSQIMKLFQIVTKQKLNLKYITIVATIIAPQIPSPQIRWTEWVGFFHTTFYPWYQIIFSVLHMLTMLHWLFHRAKYEYCWNIAVFPQILFSFSF